MKIAIFTHTFPPEFGAAPSRLYDMAKGLHKAGYSVSVYTGFPNYPTGKIYKGYKNQLRTKEIYPEFTVFRHWIFPIKSNGRWHRLINMISVAFSVFSSLPRLIKDKPSICIVQYPPMALPYSAWILSKIVRAKFIVNVSDLWPSAIADLGVMKRGLLFNILTRIEQFIYRKADYCLAQSEEIAEYIKAQKQPNVELFRTGTDVSQFSVRRKSTESDGKLKIVYIGVLGLAHHLYNLVKEVDFTQASAYLHMYGDGFERLAIENWIRKKNCSSVKLFRPVEPSSVPSLLAKYDVALVCQRTYVKGTLPSKLYEAMAASLPILYHGAGEGAAIVQKAKCGLVSSPDDYEAFKLNMQKLQNISVEERKAMGGRGFKIASEQFDRKHQIKNLVKLIKTFEEK